MSSRVEGAYCPLATAWLVRARPSSSVFVFRSSVVQPALAASRSQAFILLLKFLFVVLLTGSSLLITSLISSSCWLKGKPAAGGSGGGGPSLLALASACALVLFSPLSRVPQTHGFLPGRAFVPRLRGDVHLIEPRALPQSYSPFAYDELLVELEEGLLSQPGVQEDGLGSLVFPGNGVHCVLQGFSDFLAREKAGR